jgi:hypothetical protein
VALENKKVGHRCSKTYFTIQRLPDELFNGTLDKYVNEKTCCGLKVDHYSLSSERWVDIKITKFYVEKIPCDRKFKKSRRP